MNPFLFITSFFFIHSILAQDFDIISYGAKSDGVSLNSIAIQAAIDEAYQRGGGRVVIPKGRFLTGSIVLKTGVELHLLPGGVLLGSTNSDNYIKLNRWKALVMADGQSHIAITGKGTIDGQGRQLALHIDSLFYAGKIDSSMYNFVEMRPSHYIRPQVIEFVRCKHITIKNVTIKNSACWVQTYDQCDHIVMDNVTTISDAYWNNDGIDIQDCKNVSITNCFVNAADDGICLKSQSKEHYCDSIYIANCTVRSSASAIKFGTVSHGGFKNVIIENIKVYDTFRSAIAIECVDGGFLENILVDGLKARNTGNALFIRLGNRSKTGPTGTLKNITIRNMKVEVAFKRPDYAYEIRGPELPFFHNTFPSSITGIPGHSVENVLLENIEIRYPGKGNDGLAYLPLSRLDDIPEKVSSYPEFSMFGELPSWGLYVRHMNGLAMKNIRLRITSPDYRPAILFDDVKNADLNSVSIKDDKSYNIILHNSASIKLDNPSAAIIR
ncbi:MAG: glycosyl hydrolase family 28 protein [Bacteroidota bacterium]|nr:glycosyl hydrolase family 28 protein [Bacteroidota bacterium]